MVRRKFLGTFNSSMTTVGASGPGFSALTAAIRAVYSNEIYFQAMPNTRFASFATAKTELGVQPGTTITMPKAGSIKRGGQLTEGVRMTTQAMSLSSLTITVYEQGNAIAASEYLVQTSFYDQLAMAAMLLGRDMALVLDGQLRDVVIATSNVLYAGDKSARTSLLAGDTFGTREIYRSTETLATLLAPKWYNDYYVCFIHPHHTASLRQSPGWINAALYAGATRIFTGEVGRFNDVRFVETTMMPNGASSTVDSSTGDYVDPGYAPALANGYSGNQVTVYEALMFGEFSFGHAIALPVELRDNGVRDFGREHGLAWYAIWGTGLLETNHSLRIETA
jgi:N4-gp56 family major capsid protein